MELGETARKCTTIKRRDFATRKLQMGELETTKLGNWKLSRIKHENWKLEN